jgi:hypothetical protein
MKFTHLLALPLIAAAIAPDAPAQRSKPLPEEPSKRLEIISSNPRLHQSEYYKAMGVVDPRSRHLTNLGADRLRLDYVLSSTSPIAFQESDVELGELRHSTDEPRAAAELLNLGKLGFSERWLLAHLKQGLPQLEDVQIVDVATGRSRGGAPSTSLERSIVLTGSKSDVQAASAMLDEYTSLIRYPVQFDCRVYSKPADATAEVKPVAITVLGEEAFAQCTQDATANSTLMGHQVVIATAEQPAQFAQLNQLAYIQDFKLETIPSTKGEGIIADPVIGVLVEGFSMDFTPLVDPDGETLHFAASMEMAQLLRPLREYDIDIGTGHPVTIQLPELTKMRWSSEELSLGAGEVGFRVKNLRYTAWNDQGDSELRELELLVRANVIRPKPKKSIPLGVVIGFDASTRIAFVRLDPSVILEEGRTSFSFQRESKHIGVGVLTDSQSSILMIQVEQGEPMMGDKIR